MTSEKRQDLIAKYKAGYDEVTNQREMAPSLEAFRYARATTAQLFEFMSDDDWRREGTHSESGSYTAEDWLKIYAAHAHNHAAQIQRLKEALSESAAATA